MDSKPVVVVSKCIEHGYCRYDSSQISSAFIKRLENYVEMVTVCPEVEIGLSIPREAIRIIQVDDEKRLVYSQSGEDITERMVGFSRDYINQIKKRRLHGFILKSRSPSCGVKDVKLYKTVGKSAALGEKTGGFFGKAIIEAFEGLPIEDEGRLRNYNIREHFLTRIFTLHQFATVIEKNTMKALIEFHSHNKYLLMAYHQLNQKKLGKIVANHSDNAVDEVIAAYYQLLQKSLSTPLRRSGNMNMLMHLLGYFKNDLEKEEKAYFLDVLEQYSMKKVPFSVPIAIIYAWVIRFDETYLKEQTIFRPYPLEILDVADSGKGLD
jgi:uncharacterized protein YbgA (DUF1722 family)/uncharacterized protein YbbK (DUF523 family)